jgi:hypothetical protein
MYRRSQRHDPLDELGDQITLKQIFNWMSSFIIYLIAVFAMIIFLYNYY